MPFEPLGLLLGFAVGVVLGMLGGGGSILAVPIFFYVFHLPLDSAIAMSFPVVGMSAFVGFLTHWRQSNVVLSVALPYGLCAVMSAFAVAQRAHLLNESLRLALFALFALTAAIIMLRDSLRSPRPLDAAVHRSEAPRFSFLLALEALGVGALTALIGAGGGFVIVPALVYLARVPVKPAIGSSLLIITLNCLSSFLGNIGRVAIDWPLVASFTAVAAVGAVTGTRLNRRVPQNRLKQAFAVLILVLGTYLILQRLRSDNRTGANRQVSSHTPHVSAH
jgi:uncharacterized membrane protein YfcA